MNITILLSSSYSGSTLLSLLVTGQPGVVGFGDTYPRPGVAYKSDEVVCSCGAAIDVCPVRVSMRQALEREALPSPSWQDSGPYPLSQVPVLNSPMASGMHFASLKALPALLKQKMFGEFFAGEAAKLDALADLGYAHYFDGSKSLHRVELLRAVEDVRVVHLVKDPAAYVYSCLSKYKKGADYKELVLIWKMYNGVAYSYRRKLGEDRYLLVRYEDLAADPDTALARILGFMDVSRPYTAAADIDASKTHIIGNRMRGSFTGVQDTSQEWRDKLDPAIARYVASRVKDMPWLAGG